MPTFPADFVYAAMKNVQDSASMTPPSFSATFHLSWPARLRRLLVVLGLCVTPFACAQTVEEALRALQAGNARQAAEWLSRLANDGVTEAQYRLGILYYHGQGVSEDEGKAIFCWKRAAASGHIDAMFQIANAYLFGHQAAKTVPEPDREAAIWYFQAASAGHAEAQYHLGLLFLAGKGVIQDHGEAARWFRKAAAQGHSESQRALESLDRRRR